MDVTRAVGGHCAEFFTFGDLVGQLRQDRTVAVAAGCEFHRPDIGLLMGPVHAQQAHGAQGTRLVLPDEPPTDLHFMPSR